MQAQIRRALGVTLAAALAGQALSSQRFVNNTSGITSGSSNAGFSENVDFADIDLDVDFDAAIANGGDFGNEQNRIWNNRGPAQLGVFSDVTNAQAPAIADASRDVEFVDFDADSDVDLFVANHSQLSAQPSRWWRNSGTGSGIYVDETASRWLDLGVNNGSTAFSSLDPSQVLPGGGFIDWVGDGDFADLDNDGDMDLFLASYGPAHSGVVPSRIFLNDGDGRFAEFNPSGFTLSSHALADGEPALWAEGLQLDETSATDGTTSDVAGNPLDADLMDLDGDLDIDILLGSRDFTPRIFDNRSELGAPLAAFRDVTTARLGVLVTGGGNYEQEFGDIDGDGDVDLYGLNWSNFNDTVQINDGTGSFGPPVIVPGSMADDEEADFLDYDNDGDLDIFVAANSNQPTSYLRNDGAAKDTTAPLMLRLEQAPDRAAGPDPTVIRVQVYDNAPYYVTWYYEVRLEYAVNFGPILSVPMKSSGGQIFRGELPGELEGTICYRAAGVDSNGNAATAMAQLCYEAGGPLVYCTAKPSSAGCLNPIGSSSSSSPISGAADYSVTCAAVQGFKNGLLFAGITGPAAAPFSGGTLCVSPPLKRGPIQNSAGSGPLQCDGSFTQQVNDGLLLPAGLDAGTGNSAWYQWWYRDPANGIGTLGSALSEGLQLDFQ